MFRGTVLYMGVAALLTLTACGDGWEAKLSNTHFPYGNARTAGSGVIYVRAKMMPEKQIVLENKETQEAQPHSKPVERKREPKAMTPAEQKMEKVFKEQQKK